MASLPESVLAGVARGSSSFFSVQPPNAMPTGLQSATVDQLIHLLTKDQYREEAISILSKVYLSIYLHLYLFLYMSEFCCLIVFVSVWLFCCINMIFEIFLELFL